MDTRTHEKRSEIMSAVRTKNTGPELLVRKLLSAQGYRYRLHRKGLPGRPDIVFPGRRKVVFVHGCFWHGHRCKKGRLPKSRLRYWKPKIAANKKRDARNLAKLRRLGWNALVVWQCQQKKAESLMCKLKTFLGRPSERRRGKRQGYA
ncbi:MAG: DNA mismatch endonuclease Vsr [Gammaproteobacteria bacterium]|nr:DNA mismatch endonuclease Vsr [Gammaproteobacteria bacterium]